MVNQLAHRAGEIRLANGHILDTRRTLVMGVINVTPDSFSDGGQYLDADEAVAHAHRMISDGADIIDIGGESSRPGSDPVDEKTELDRVIPIIREIRDFSDTPISIDTTKAEVARQAVLAGADIINDISALRFDREMVEVVAENRAPVVLMHMLGIPKTMQVDPSYADCISEVMQFFSERLHHCLNYGITKERIILDPGIGFGKRLQDNLTIISRLKEFKTFECPIMLGTSRKSFIGMISGEKDHPESRIGGSLASALIAIMNGANIIRVHDVAETIEAIKIHRALKEIG